MAIPIALSEGLDAAAARERFARDGYTTLTNVLRTPDARRLLKAARDHHAWNLVALIEG